MTKNIDLDEISANEETIAFTKTLAVVPPEDYSTAGGYRKTARFNWGYFFPIWVSCAFIGLALGVWLHWLVG